MGTKEDIVCLTGGKIRSCLEKIEDNMFNTIQEIRIRADNPIRIRTCDKEHFDIIGHGFKPSLKDISQTMEVISGYSLYAFNEEIRNGFISLKGGHRIGLFGKAIISDGKVIDLRQISSLNIRISHDIKGCGERIFPLVYKNGKVQNTMIISPPGCGKTTLLRDLIRLISNKGICVSVIDERSEICSGNLDYGENTDVLDGCPKVLGMKMALRSMSPQVIAVDEIGTKFDADAIWEMTCCGVNVICTAHGETIESLIKRNELNELFNKKVFERFIFLQNKEGITGEIKSVLNDKLENIWKEDG